MRLLFGFLVALSLAGCGTDEPIHVVNLAPAAPQNAATSVHIVNASAKAKEISQKGSKPGDPVVAGLIKDLTDARGSAKSVQDELAIAQQEAVDQGKREAKLKAQHEADRKAIDKRNLLFLVALYLGSALFYGGSWAKLASPYTALLPDLVAGLLTVTIFAILSTVVISFWSAFGWLIHLFF